MHVVFLRQVCQRYPGCPLHSDRLCKGMWSSERPVMCFWKLPAHKDSVRCRRFGPCLHLHVREAVDWLDAFVRGSFRVSLSPSPFLLGLSRSFQHTFSKTSPAGLLTRGRQERSTAALRSRNGHSRSES